MHLINFLAIWLLHPLGYCSGPTTDACRGYNFWSGIGSDFGELTLVGGLLMIIRAHNCHVKGCWRLGAHPFRHYKLCSKHHPDVPQKVTHLHIKKLHKSVILDK